MQSTTAVGSPSGLKYSAVALQLAASASPRPCPCLMRRIVQNEYKLPLCMCCAENCVCTECCQAFTQSSNPFIDLTIQFQIRKLYFLNFSERISRLLHPLPHSTTTLHPLRLAVRWVKKESSPSYLRARSGMRAARHQCRPPDNATAWECMSVMRGQCCRL